MKVQHELTLSVTGSMRKASALRFFAGLAAVAAAAACADHATPTAPRSLTASPVSLSQKPKDGKKVAVCKLQKEAWKSAQIGSRGGSVRVGGAELDVPAGALASTITITAHALPTTSASVQFSPEGLHFALAATLKMDYSKCNTPLLGASVVYVQADTVTEVEPSNNHPWLEFVTARINHFSSYAVAF